MKPKQHIATLSYSIFSPVNALASLQGEKGWFAGANRGLTKAN